MEFRTVEILKIYARASIRRSRWLRLVENEVKPYPIEEWIASIEKAKTDKSPAQPRAEGKFVNIDVTGNAAVVKLEIYREGKKTFTDYLSLYKFSEGWRIVSKIYNRH